MRYETVRHCPIAGHTNTYHTYTLSDALNGIERAQLRWVELSAVPGWTEHVNLDRDRPAEVRKRLDRHGLSAISLSAHSDLTTSEGVRHAQKAITWAAEYGLAIVNTAIGGHASDGENEAAFLDNIGPLADAADVAGIVIALETHGDLMATGGKSLALMREDLSRIRAGQLRHSQRYVLRWSQAGRRSARDHAIRCPRALEGHRWRQRGLGLPRPRVGNGGLRTGA